MAVSLDLAPLPWADLVFHVLAHVRATAHLPASSYDPVYVGYAQRRIGAAERRTLGEDAIVLGRVVDTHQALARLQLLAWLFEGTERAMACAEETLDEVQPAQVDAPSLLLSLQRFGPAVEVLRCAALLELEAWSALPAETPDAARLQGRLERVGVAAPHLGRCVVRLVPSLRLRGRVRAREVWVGMPATALRVSCEHVAWQAAHEATVAEVGEVMIDARREPTHRGVERVAAVLMAERAREAGIAEEHAVWFERLGGSPPSQRCRLSSDEVAVLQCCRTASG